MKKTATMKPILFSTPMVRAILDGRKTMTRRIIKNPVPVAALIDNCQPDVICEDFAPHMPGNVLYVRETFANVPHGFIDGIQVGPYIYRADINEYGVTKWSADWKPSLFMPKDAARIFLKVTAVKAERLQDINEADAIAEGIKPVQDFDSGNGLSGKQMFENYLPKGYTEVRPLDSFQSLWRSINGDDSWNLNPWVWAYTFERCERPD